MGAATATSNLLWSVHTDGSVQQESRIVLARLIEESDLVTQSTPRPVPAPALR